MTSVFDHSFCHFTSPAIGRDQLSAPLRVKSALYHFYSQHVYLKGKEMQVLIGVPHCAMLAIEISPLVVRTHGAILPLFPLTQIPLYDSCFLVPPPPLLVDANVAAEWLAW